MKKKKTVKKAKVKTSTLMDRLPKNQGERLELMIKFTERAINPAHPDKGMVAQKERLQAELKAWKASNSK